MSSPRCVNNTTEIEYCFFFQAEDGIRDHCVTGVQTCALPISSRRASAAACGRPAAYPAMLVATLHRALSRRDLPSISPLASAIEVCREPPRQRGEVIQDGLGLHLPALEILQAGSVGDERYAGGGRGHAIHP